MSDNYVCLGTGLQEWLTNNDKFEADEDGLTRMSFPCCACKHRNKTDRDEPCRSCGHNLNADIDKPNAELTGPERQD